VKLLYVINVLGQFFLMNAFLSSKWTSFYGFELIYDLSTGHEWYASGRFPRVTFCDFEMRVLGNVQRHTLQCVLMINMFNEKIYIFLWWWCFFVANLTIFSFCNWIVQMSFASKRIGLIKRYLNMNKLMKGKLEHGDVADFTTKKLQKDGVFMIRILSEAGGATVAYDVVAALWNKIHPPGHRASSPGTSSVSTQDNNDKSPDYVATKVEDI